MSKTFNFLFSLWPLRLLTFATITLLLFVEWVFIDGSRSETTRLIGLIVVMWQLMELKIQTE